MPANDLEEACATVNGTRSSTYTARSTAVSNMIDAVYQQVDRAKYVGSY